MDILYVVGKGFSEWNDNELRYSLRSIAKYGKNVRRVYVVGHCPYWLNPEEVTLLPLRDEGNNKHVNILRAIEYAIEKSDISEQFLYSSDDHYYVRETDFDNYPVYWRGYDLPDTEPQKPTWYQRTMKQTHDVLRAFGLPARFYAWHGNTHFNTRLWKQQRMVFLRRLAQTMPDGCDPSCLMLNYWEGVEPETMPERVARNDGKIIQEDAGVTIERKIEDKEVLSTTDIVGVGFKTWLQKQFPKYCKYENKPRF